MTSPLAQIETEKDRWQQVAAAIAVGLLIGTVIGLVLVTHVVAR